MFVNVRDQRPKIRDEILREHHVILPDINTFDLSIDKPRKSSRRQNVELKPDSVFLSEVNADLWDRALVTAITDINQNFCPHHSVVHTVVNHALNSYPIDFSLTKCFFMKLVLFHPPECYDTQNYYWSFLNDRYIVLNLDKGEEENAFWCLIDILREHLINKECSKDFMNKSFDGSFFNSKQGKVHSVVDLTNKLLVDEDQATHSGRKEKIFFESFSPKEQVERVLVVLEFLCTILEIDYLERIKQNNFSTNGCLLSTLVWQNPDNVGLINEKAKKLIHIWFMMERDNFCHFVPFHRKLLMILSEIIRSSDANAGCYPFLYIKSHSLADEISLHFVRSFKENIRVIKMLKPHWLRLLVSSGLLSRITGKLCPPELITAHDILEYVTLIWSKNKVLNKKGLKDKRAKSRNMRGSIKYCACGIDKSKRTKLSVDSSSYNARGWTMLHEAVLNGHKKCVEKLLKDDGQNTIDVRQKAVNNFTPLMCAVVTNRTGISRQLLEHSGRILLTDVDSKGRTPMDLCQSKDVSDVLESFQFTFSIGKDDLEAVVVLCVQLAESYFITHRTWDLWNCQARIRRSQAKSIITWDRHRYETDIKMNVDKLTTTVIKVMEFKELRRFVEPLAMLLT